MWYGACGMRFEVYQTEVFLDIKKSLILKNKESISASRKA